MLKKLSILILMIFPMLLSGKNYYGKTKPEQYVLGRFNFRKHSLFISAKKAGIPVKKGRNVYIRKEVAKVLKRVFQDFKKAHPNIRLYITSGTRNYWIQKSIWNAKWSGRRKVGGGRLPKTHPGPYQRALKILEYSSMPGTSRHHWGTDVDFNILINSYFERGNGKIIFRWMKKNMHKYGFCQTYTSGRKSGYFEEKWHWSYLPLARKMNRDWNRFYSRNPHKINSGKGFKGSKYKKITKLAPIYVNSINEKCK